MSPSRNQPCGAEKEPLSPVSEPSAAYRAHGLRVMKNPERRTKPDGSRAVVLGFEVCRVGDFVGEEGAEEIARVLNGHDALVSALQRIAAATPNNTNSATLPDFMGWIRAVANTAIADTSGRQRIPGRDSSES